MTNFEKKANEVLSNLRFPATIDPVANDDARDRNVRLIVEAMRWAREAADHRIQMSDAWLHAIGELERFEKTYDELKR